MFFGCRGIAEMREDLYIWIFPCPLFQLEMRVTGGPSVFNYGEWISCACLSP